MATVTVTMFDILEEKTIERTICASNILVNDTKAALNCEGHIIGTVEQQRERLSNWINERANKQHDTLLELVSWTVNNN